MTVRSLQATDDEFRDLVIADAIADFEASDGPVLVTRLAHANLQLRSYGLADATAGEVDDATAYEVDDALS